jgi:hypothetical protein
MFHFAVSGLLCGSANIGERGLGEGNSDDAPQVDEVATMHENAFGRVSHT